MKASRDWKRGVFRNLPWTRLECGENLKVRSLIRSCWLVPELCMGSTTGRKEWLSCDQASGSIMRPKQSLYLIVLHMSLRKTLEAKKLIFFVCQRAEYAILEFKHSLCSLCWGDIKVYCSEFQSVLWPLFIASHYEPRETTPSPLQAVFHLAPDKNKHSYQPHPPPLKHKLIKQKLPTFLIVFNFENTSVGDASLWKPTFS